MQAGSFRFYHTLALRQSGHSHALRLQQPGLSPAGPVVAVIAGRAGGGLEDERHRLPGVGAQVYGVGMPAPVGFVVCRVNVGGKNLPCALLRYDVDGEGDAVARQQPDTQPFLPG